jgi:hypothetical protein
MPPHQTIESSNVLCDSTPSCPSAMAMPRSIKNQAIDGFSEEHKIRESSSSK